jgi:hypothetical protein
MDKKTGTLVVIPQAVSTGVRASPYRIQVFEGHKESLPKAAKYRAAGVLGNPTKFKLDAGKYTVRVSNSKEGEFVQRTSVRTNEETLLPISVGRLLAHDYNDLLVQMAPVQKRFETFMLDLAGDAGLQSRFLADPEKTLQQAKLLPRGGGLSRKNRLFIALLANDKLRKLVRDGERRVKVPASFRKSHTPRLRRILKEQVSGGRQPTPELVDSAVQGRFFFQEVLTSILTDPILKKLYRQTFSRKDVDLLFDATYAFADRTDPTGAAQSFAAASAPGIAAVITFSVANLKAGVGVNNSAAIFVNAGVFTKSTVFTSSSIFTKTKVVCSVSPVLARDIGVADDFDLFDDHTVAPELSNAFDLDDAQVNELSNFATIADAIIEGMNLMDYEKALAYARVQLEGAIES